MATVNAQRPVTHSPHAQSAWSKFTAAEHEAMKREDSLAFGIVAGELVAIVVLGFVLVASTLCVILFR